MNLNNENTTLHLLKQLQICLKNKDIKGLREITNEYYPADIAETLLQLEEHDILKCIRWMNNDIGAHVFANLNYDAQKYVVNSFNNVELSDLIDDLYADEIADVIEEMPSNLVKKLLRASPPDMRSKINQILQYTEDSAGSIMNVNFLELEEGMSVKAAMNKIWKNMEDLEETEYFFVVNKSHVLIGVVELKSIVFSPPTKLISELVNKKVFAVLAAVDQEEVANMFLKYDLDVLPVVNSQHRLVGIIDAPDVADVIEKESTEDIHKLAGIEPLEKSYFETKVLRMVRSRSVWLLFLMISATVSQLVIQAFLSLYHVTDNSDGQTTSTITFIVTGLLIPVLPLVSGTSGNAGSQSSTMIVRALSLNQVKVKDFWRVMWKELRIAAITGLILILVNFIRMIIIYLIENGSHINFNQWKTIAVLSLALYLTVILAKIVGGILPIFAKMIKLDPAVMAAPLLTTLVDALSTAIFFSIGAIFFLT